MDANGQRFWMLSDWSQWQALDNYSHWAPERRTLQLLSHRQAPDLPTDRAQALTLSNQASATMDHFDTWAFIDNKTIKAGGGGEGSKTIVTADDDETLLDIAMAPDGVLYGLIHRTSTAQKEVHLWDRHGRFESQQLVLESDFQPDRVSYHAEQGAWLLDRSNKILARVQHLPAVDIPRPAPTKDIPIPCEPLPPALRYDIHPDVTFASDKQLVDHLSLPNGQVVFLLFPTAGDQPAEVVFLLDKGLSAPIILQETIAPFSMTWLGDQRFAFLFAHTPEAVVFELPPADIHETKTAIRSGHRYPIKRSDTHPLRFCRHVASQAYYQYWHDAEFQPKALHRLSLPSLAKHCQLELKTPIDGERQGMVWHRVYVEAHIPNGCGLLLELVAAEQDTEQAWGDSVEATLVFGQVPGITDSDALPKASWDRRASEIAFHPGLLPCPQKENISGLFMCLIQKQGCPDSQLKGRYLKVRMHLYGNALLSPEVAAVRFYGSRFSYLHQYLPKFYQDESQLAQSPVNQASEVDFMSRYLCLFESVLTPLEDQVADAYLLSQAEQTPKALLQWLAGWIGLELDEQLPEHSQRRLIAKATQLYRSRGTMAGLALALDLAMDNLVSEKHIVLLEDFRLRRTFATILGADLGREQDPLFQEDIPNANSYVGDTLYLGSEYRREFLSLFDADVNTNAFEQRQIDRFFSRLANRVTVLVHKAVEDETLERIEKIVAQEIPAHIQFRVLRASKPIVVGLYSLVGMDTYLREKPQWRAATLNKDVVGRLSLVKQNPSLDPRVH